MLQDYNQTLRPAGTSLYPDSYREEDLICCGVFCQKERTVATHSFVYVMKRSASHIRKCPYL